MLKRHQGDKFGCDGGLGVLYFAQPAVEFPEILELMETYRGAYGVQYLEYTCSFKDGMKALVERPPPAVPVKGVFLGVRRGDPGTDSISADNIHKSDHFQASSADWPVFMRIYPVLDWSYEQGKYKCTSYVHSNFVGYLILFNISYLFCVSVSTSVWRFMRTCELPYCSLYDVGYTSIGNINNTVPNKALEMEVESGAERRYRPAYELEDPSLERCNRVSKPGGKS